MAEPNTATSLADVPAASWQAYFAAILQMLQWAGAQLGSAGEAPEMVWKTDAYTDPTTGEPRGGFVPTGKSIPTLAAVNQAFSHNTTQINTIASVAGQAGKVPHFRIAEDGSMEVGVDAHGNIVYEESNAGRQTRMAAGQAVGYLSADLLRPPVGNMDEVAAWRRLAGGNKAGSFTGPGNPDTPVSGTAPRVGGTTRTSTSAGSGRAPLNVTPGQTTNPAIGTDYPVYSDPSKNLQYPSGTGTNAQGLGGSAYALSTPYDDQTAGGRASDGQSFRDQPPEVRQMFVDTYGSQDAEQRWLDEHNAAGGGAAGGGAAGGAGVDTERGMVAADAAGSVQDRLRRRIEAGVIPQELLTEAAPTAATPGIADMQHQVEFGRLPGVTYSEPADDPNRVRYGAQTYAPGERFAGGEVDATGTRRFIGREDEGGPLGYGEAEATPSGHVRLGRADSGWDATANGGRGGPANPGGAYYGAQPHAFTTGTSGGPGGFAGSGLAGLNVDFGSGGQGDPTDDAGPYRESQSDPQWVQGSRLFENPRPWENLEGDWAPLGNMVGRSDTPSGLNTVEFPAPYVELLRRSIVVGRLRPTERGWQFLQQKYGITPQNINQQYGG